MKPTDFAGFRWIGLATNLNWRAAVFSVSIPYVTLAEMWRRMVPHPEIAAVRILCVT
jgi:hypothetical protein